MTSPVAEKLALFASRFHARTDVYAIRWENARTGAAGWMPAVAGGWRKGMDRRTARHLRLTPEVLAAHLAGETFIGLYPLLRDNSCRFLVADLDGPTAMLDALAVIKAARANDVAAGLELSQSGQGAHVWIFFADAIPATTARALATLLIHEAIAMRGTMDLRSYDRLFPNQDMLPNGGFGNLIAAPLQGRRRRDGLTLFLDLATLEPCEDQWAYLSTLDRISPRHAAHLARRAERTVVSGEVRELARPAATSVHPRLSPVVRAELGAGLAIDIAQLTPAAQATFKHAASMANPKFYELQRLRKSTWDTPRFVRGYDVTIDDRIVIPRGLRHKITEIIEQAGSRLALEDIRHPGEELNVACSAELDTAQSVAVSTMLAHDDGVLVAPPGAGKTVMASMIIAERATTTLVLVDRRALADQWRERIADLLDYRPGQIGGGRRKLTGVIDIAMLPSLTRRDDVGELTRGYGHVVVDECHHLAAAAYDHSVKRIGARYWLGLTATPTRRDGLGALVTWQLGPIRHTVSYEEPDTIAAAISGRGVPHRVLHIHQTTFESAVDRADANALAAVHRQLADDAARSEQIVDDIHRAISQGRNCLVLTRRVAHVEALTAMLEERGHTPFVLRGGLPTGRRLEIVARLAEAEVGDGVLVLGTTPFIGEGFDAPALDTLFLAAPVSFDGLLLQCAGRVIRPMTSKHTAEVHDYHDAATPILAASLERRMPGYRALGFTRK